MNKLTKKSKKISYFLALALLATALSGPTLANEPSKTPLAFKPYFGFDLQHTAYDFANSYMADGISINLNNLLEDRFNGGSVYIGNRFTKYMGLELGYFRNREEDRAIVAGASLGPGIVAATDFTTKFKTQGFTLDALGYLPLNQEGQVELIGTAGVTYTKAEATLEIPGFSSENIDESEFGLRFGAGAQFNITESIGLRGMARYQTADFDGAADNAWTYSVGLNYNF